MTIQEPAQVKQNHFIGKEHAALNPGMSLIFITEAIWISVSSYTKKHETNYTHLGKWLYCWHVPHGNENQWRQQHIPVKHMPETN